MTRKRKLDDPESSQPQSTPTPIKAVKSELVSSRQHVNVLPATPSTCLSKKATMDSDEEMVSTASGSDVMDDMNSSIEFDAGQ